MMQTAGLHMPILLLVFNRPATTAGGAEVAAGRTSLVRITLTATATYKGKTVSKTMTTEVAERQDNVRPQC